jgi:hypothetical protein
MNLGRGKRSGGRREERMAQMEYVVRKLEVEERRFVLLELGRGRQHIIRHLGPSTPPNPEYRKSDPCLRHWVAIGDFQLVQGRADELAGSELLVHPFGVAVNSPPQIHDPLRDGFRFLENVHLGTPSTKPAASSSTEQTRHDATNEARDRYQGAQDMKPNRARANGPPIVWRGLDRPTSDELTYWCAHSSIG